MNTKTQAAIDVAKPALPYTWHLVWMVWMFAEVVALSPGMAIVLNVFLSVFLVVVLGSAAVLVQLCCHTVCRAAYTEWKNRVSYLEYEREQQQAKELERVRELNEAMREK